MPHLARLADKADELQIDQIAVMPFEVVWLEGVYHAVRHRDA